VPDVLIHRCTLRVVRRGGWSWGPSPKKFVEEIVRTIPVLLAKKVHNLMDEAEDRELSAPVRIRVLIRLADLVSSMTSVSLASNSEQSVSTPLEMKVESAIRSAFSLRVRPPSPSPQEPGKFQSPDSDDSDVLARNPESAVAQLLASWHLQGQLESSLAEFSLDELLAWHDALRSATKAPFQDVRMPDSELVSDLREFVAEYLELPPPPDRATRLRRRILIATRACAKFNLPLTMPFVWEVLDSAIPVTAEEASSSAQTQAAELADDPIGTESGPANPPHAHSPTAIAQLATHGASTYPVTEWEVHVKCVLPFLLLGPLSRLGYFRVLAAVLEAAKVSEPLHPFAAALAYKVLDPPERGWRRSPSSIECAAAFAGELSEIPEEKIAAFSAWLAGHLGPLDRLLADSLIRGHAREDPILLLRSESVEFRDFFVFDTQGCFPIACSAELGPLVPILRRVAGSHVLVSNFAATPECLATLDNAGVRFVVGVPPTRSEAWNPVQFGLQHAGWTNHPEPCTVEIFSAAKRLSQAVSDSEKMVTELAFRRPGVIRPSSLELERSLTLAAANSLATIAWILWKSRGPTSAQFALERFGDLDARIQFDSKRVWVRLPLGRRHRELSENGFLNPIGNLAWLGGRRLEFSGD